MSVTGGVRLGMDVRVLGRALGRKRAQDIRVPQKRTGQDWGKNWEVELLGFRGQEGPERTPSPRWSGISLPDTRAGRGDPN
jgi:hypothetical protein